MTTPTSTGMNRTGMQMSPLQSGRLMEISENSATRPGDELAIARFRQRYANEAEPVGTVPPPGSMKGMATTALQMLKGDKPSVFIDKLGERLAFERTGVRLYDAVLAKFDALGGWDRGPSRPQLLQIRDEELEHFEMLENTIQRLGADPTAMTPSADITAVEAGGMLKVVGDARTTVPQALHAMLAVEGADLEGWGLLIELSRSIGQNDLASRFENAQSTEERHTQWVRQWLSAAVIADAHREISGGGH